MAEFDKGDWIVVGRVGAGIAIGSDSGKWIAIVYGPGQHEEAAQNAALIAAAPDLLRAARTAERFMAGFEDDEMQHGINENLALIRSAIEEAERRS